jgi:hypothetical protein
MYDVCNTHVHATAKRAAAPQSSVRRLRRKVIQSKITIVPRSDHSGAILKCAGLV